MEVAAGTRLGPFEILAPLGAGGMGEVYRARDKRLGRDVAIKVLPADQRADPDRIRRFEQEARAVGALNHPNILSVYDVGVYDGTTCLVTELLDGETLRKRLARGPIPPHKAMELAIQIAEGLAAAHARDIAHRDLKPDNVFVTRDGRVKILDFGLAKFLAVGETTEGGSTLPAGTAPGAILGTIGYMAPEQVRGQAADARADIFAFGAILHEMLAGTRAFRRDTPIETGHAILNDDPPELPGIDPSLANIVGRCLEKRPEERFQSARDIAFALEALSEGSSSGRSAAAPAARPRARWMRWLPLVASALLAAGATAEWAMARRAGSGEPPIYRRLTFHRGTILSARFLPDGQSVVYGAAWDGKPFEVFVTRPGAPESRPLGLTDASPLAVSPSGELAVLVHVNAVEMWEVAETHMSMWLRTGRLRLAMPGTLARVPLDGGEPREVLEDVTSADWAPDGAGLAAIRRVTVDGQTKFQVEFPIGHVLFGAGGWLGFLRFSPDGKRLAFVDNEGITVIGREGKPTRIGDLWEVSGLAWSRSGDEILFAGAGPGAPFALRGITMAGRQRVIARIAGNLTVHDVSAQGKVLVTSDRSTAEMKVLAPGETQERDLSWLDESYPSELSADGKTVLFCEVGDAVSGWTAYVRRTDGSSPTRLGDGWPAYGSPDGQWVVMKSRNGPAEMVPTGPGSPRPLPTAGTSKTNEMIWSRDGKRVAFESQEPGHQPRYWVQDYPQGSPHPVTDEVGLYNYLFSPDGKRLALGFVADELRIVPVEGGPAVQSFPLGRRDHPIQWTADGTAMYIVGPADARVLPLRLRIDLLDLASGRRERWRELAPAEPAGAITMALAGLTSDGRSYLYGVIRHLNELYVVDGVSLQ